MVTILYIYINKIQYNIKYEVEYVDSRLFNDGTYLKVHEGFLEVLE